MPTSSASLMAKAHEVLHGDVDWLLGMANFAYRGGVIGDFAGATYAVRVSIFDISPAATAFSRTRSWYLPSTASSSSSVTST